MNKVVVITGAMGFIGSHTAKVFKDAGYRVIGIDHTETIPQAKRYIDEYIKSDFVAVAAPVINLNNARAVIHCGGTSLVGPSMTNPGKYYDNNVAKTNRMLDDLQMFDWQGTVVFSSSAATYGIPKQVPIKETDAQLPINPYGHTKLMCEHIIADHCLAHGMKGVALRYFNACGCDPHGTLGHVVNDTHMIPMVLSSHQASKTFVLNGDIFPTPDGTCIRDYLHVMDIAHAHLEAVNLSDSMAAGAFRAYNLGTGHGYSNKEIVDACSKVVGSDINYRIGPIRPGDPDRLVADSTLFQQETSWKPVFSDINTIVMTAWNWQKTLS